MVNLENFDSETKKTDSTHYFLEQEELRQKLLWNVKREVIIEFQ